MRTLGGGTSRANLLASAMKFGYPASVVTRMIVASRGFRERPPSQRPLRPTHSVSPRCAQVFEESRPALDRPPGLLCSRHCSKGWNAMRASIGSKVSSGYFSALLVLVCVFGGFALPPPAQAKPAILLGDPDSPDNSPSPGPGKTTTQKTSMAVMPSTTLSGSVVSSRRIDYGAALPLLIRLWARLLWRTSI